MEQRTRGNQAGAFLSTIYALLSQMTLEMSCSEMDDEFVESSVETIAEAVQCLAPSDWEWDGSIKLDIGDDMKLEIETVIRIRQDEGVDNGRGVRRWTGLGKKILANEV